MKKFKFDMNGSYTFFFGRNLGEAISEFIRLYPMRVNDIIAITEEPTRQGIDTP